MCHWRRLSGVATPAGQIVTPTFSIDSRVLLKSTNNHSRGIRSRRAASFKTSTANPAGEPVADLYVNGGF